MSTSLEQIYELLPAIYRIRDAEPDDALKMLLSVIAEQIGVVEDDIARLYDNWFIETCDEWLVPYIGDLLGVQGLHQISAAGFTQRARVANTLGYRRRKGTATMLEQLARDTTLWAARAVEFFELLATTQYLNHVRLHSQRPDLRDANTLALLDTPFDSLAHSVDVRRIASGRGKHNIPHVGLFLWRLQDYEVLSNTPRPVAAPADGRYTFTPIGHDAPVFIQPRSEETIDHLAEETDVPAPIRPLAFYLDIADYRSRNVGLADRPLRSTYYGPDTSLNLIRDGVPVPPIEIACMDLRHWARPPARMRGVLSGPLAPFPAISAPATAATPAVNVTIGGEGPHPAVLGAVPGNLTEAASMLEAALRRAHPGVNFTAARVVPVDDRLLVLPGIRGSGVAFAAAAADATTAAELQLDTAVPVQGALSTRLSPFPRLSGGRLRVTIAGSGPFELNLGAIPASVSDAAALLEAAIRAADPSPPFANARVIAAGDSLLVLPGTPGGVVTFTPAPDDPVTVHQLGLANRVGIDVRLGRIAFPLEDVPGDLTVSYTYGFSGDIGGGPYDRRVIRRPEEPPPSAYEDSVAAPDGLGVRLVVPSAAFATIGQALTEWETVLGQPDAVIEIADSRTYGEDLTINLAATDLVIQAQNGRRPALIGDVTVNGNGQGRLALNGLLVAGGLTVAQPDCLRQLDVAHCTLVPGHLLNIDRSPQKPQEPSIAVNASNTNLQVVLDRSISGPLCLPAEIDSLVVRDSIVESAFRDKPASVVPALVSGSLSPFPGLGPAKPELRVTIGEDGPYTVRLASKPTTLATARDRLQEAIRSAHDSPAFTGAHVISAKNRLIVLPGVPAAVSIEPSGSDDTAERLRLSSGEGRPVFALVSGPLPASLSLTAALPSLVVSVRGVSHTITLSPVPASPAQARDALQAAVAGANPDPAFSDAIVGHIGETEQLVALPGVEGEAIAFGGAAGDPATVIELGLECDLPAIAGNRTGERPGPPTVLEQVTVLGAVHVRDLVLASEVIFGGSVYADRRQSGCVRFSYVRPGSRTPRRYRCQPDLEIAAQIAAAEEKALAAETTLSQPQRDAIRQRILEWLAPAFTTTEYGLPAYAQLSLTCPVQIKEGAEDGSEMGAFSFLKQPQREANLRASLDEYLRFGLEAGLFYVT